MKKLLFLSLVLLGITSVFAQSRPKVDDTLQKTNKRPPQKTIENQTKSEKSSNDVEQGSAAEQPSENSTNTADAADEVLRIDTNLVTIPVRISDRGIVLSAVSKKRISKSLKTIKSRR